MMRKDFARHFIFGFWLLVVLFFSAGAAFGQVAPPAGIVGWWAGDGDARDASGNGNNATLAPSPNTPGFEVGKVGQAFKFTAEGQYASIPDSAAMRPQSITIEGWARLDSPVNVGHIFGKALGTIGHNSYVVWYQNGTLQAGS